MALLGVSVAPTDDWNEASPSWERLDVTYNVTGWDIDRGRAFEFDRMNTGRATVSLVDDTGDFDPTNTSGAYWDLTLRQAGIALQNPTDSSWSTLFRGFVSRVEWVPYQNKAFANVTLELVDGLALAAATEMAPDGTFGDVENGNITFPEDLSTDAMQTRIERVLDEWGWAASLREIFTGNVKLWKKVYAPRTPVLSVILDALEAEFPEVANGFISKVGVFTAHGRLARFDPTNPDYDINFWSLGDDVAAIADPTNVVRISPPLLVYRDDSRIYTAAIATDQNIADADIEDQYHDDDDNAAIYGLRTWSAEGLNTAGGASSATAADVTDLFSRYYVNNFSTPRTRCGAITVRPQRANGRHGAAAWDLMCGVDISDSVHLTTTHVGGGGFDDDFFVEGVSYKAVPMNATQHEVTLTLDVSPASYYDFDPFS